jgi:hypothetical protein
MFGDIVIKSSGKKYLNTILVAAVLLSANVCFASDTGSQNNLLKTDIYKTSKNGVRVNLYTSHPYKEPLVVNKKSDREYVIYLPGTVNSQTARAHANADVVQNVDIKSQSGKNGYTKVLITTSKAVDITPQVQTLAPYKMTDAEYKNLMSHVRKKPSQQSTETPKAAQKVSSAKKVVLTKPAQKVTKTAKKTQTAAKTTKKENLNLVQKTQHKVLAAPKAMQKALQGLTKKSKPVTQAKKISKPAQKVVKTQTIVKPQVKQVKKSIKPTKVIQKNEVKPVTPAKQIQKVQQLKPIVAQKPVAKTISKPPVKLAATPQKPTLNKQKVSPDVTVVQENQKQKNFAENIISKIKNKAKGQNVFLLSALTALPILLLLLIIGKLKKGSKIKFNEPLPEDEEIFNPNIPQSPQTPNVDAQMPENINNFTPQTPDIEIQKGENWRETYNNYIQKQKLAETEQQAQKEAEQVQHIDNLFSEIDELPPQTPQELEQNKSTSDEISKQKEEENSFINQPEKVNIEQEETILPPQTQMPLDEETSPEIKTPIDTLKSVRPSFAEENNENDDISLSEIFEDDEEENPIDNSDENVDLSILSDEDEEEIEQEEINSSENIQAKNNEAITSINVAPFVNVEESIETPILPPATPVFEKVTAPNAAQEKPSADELGENSIESTYALDSNKGFYLVDYNNKTSLVGYINDNVFVLKQFDEHFSGKIKVRLSEDKETSKNYLVKTTDFKALVDVSEENMKVLIEL